MSSFNRGRSQLNVGQGGDYPFINICKTMGIWSQISPFGQPDLDDFDLDTNGYPTAIVNGGLTFPPVTMPTQAEKPGNWVATWDGTGTIRCSAYNAGSLTTISGSTSSGRFVFLPSASVIDLDIGVTAVGSPSDYVHNLRVFHSNDEALLDAGEYFNPDYLAKLRRLNPVLRFLNWNAAGSGGPSTWSTRKPLTYYTWFGNELRMNLWAGIPTLAGTAYSCTLSGFSLVDKATVQLKWGTVGATSGTYTLNVSGTGAKQLRDPSGNALTLGNNTYPTTAFIGTFVYDADLDCWLSFGGNLQFNAMGLANGVPYEACLQLCDRIGAHPWFTSPYLALDPPTDWIPSMVSLVASTASPWMRPVFEPSNETWNYAYPFPQTAYADNKATVHWGGTFGYNEWYGMVLSNIGQKVKAVFGTGANIVGGVQTFAGSWSNSRLTSANYVTTGPTFSGYTRQAAYLTTTHVAGANYYAPAYYGTGTETTLVANWVAAGRPSYANDSNGYLRTYVLSCASGGSYTIDQVEAVLSSLKTYAQTNNVSKLTCYEGGYSPDYTSNGTTDTDKFIAASKQVPDLYGYTITLYNYILSLTGGGFTGEFPSCFVFTGPTPSQFVWSIVEDLYQSPDQPQFQAIDDFNTVAPLQVFTGSISYAAGKITTRPVKIPQC